MLHSVVDTAGSSDSDRDEQGGGSRLLVAFHKATVSRTLEGMQLDVSVDSA